MNVEALARIIKGQGLKGGDLVNFIHALGLEGGERNDLVKALDLEPADLGTLIKALGVEASGGDSGLSVEDLDAALEPFAKGLGDPEDFASSGEEARLDVTNFLGTFIEEVRAGHQLVHRNQEAIAKGLHATGTLVKQLVESQETQAATIAEMQRSIKAPAATSTVERESQLGGDPSSVLLKSIPPSPVPGSMPVGGAGIIPPPPEAAAGQGAGPGKFGALTVGQVRGHLIKGYQAAEDPAQKARIDRAITELELGGQIDDNFFTMLGLTEPRATVH